MYNNLREWKVEFECINISYNSYAKAFLKGKGVKMVPAVFRDDKHLNKDIDTNEFTKEMLDESI